jgi:hypothetical protein
MRTLVAVALVLGANALLLAAAMGPSPWLAAGPAVVLAIVVNLTAGIRVGYECAHAHVEDVARINRLLVDQNSELVQANREMLERTAQLHVAPVLHRREGQRA